MYRNHNPPTAWTIDYRKRLRSNRPRLTELRRNLAHRYVGVSRQAVTTRIDAHHLTVLPEHGWHRSRYASLVLSELDDWIDQREAHLPAKACGRRRVPKRRTVTKHRPKKTR